MLKAIKAEYLKLHHTFGAWLPVAAPVFTLCLVLPWACGMGSAMFAGAWNWWYTLLLPGMLVIFCYLGMKKDQRINYYNLLLIPVPVEKCLAGKIAYASLGLLSANFLIFAGTWFCGVLFQWSVPVTGGFCAFLVLSVTYLCAIPLYFFLSARFGLLSVLLVSMALQMFSVAFIAGSAYWWVFPMAIPVRLMCPVLSILPNGLAVPEGSGLWHSGVLVPGILLSLAWFVLLAGLTMIWFHRKAVVYGNHLSLGRRLSDSRLETFGYYGISDREVRENEAAFFEGESRGYLFVYGSIGNLMEASCGSR